MISFSTIYNMAISNGDWVKVSYEGTLKDGTVFDTSKGREPITFEVGKGTVIKGFDDNVEGMDVGADKEFTIPCKDAYGEESDSNQEEVPLSFFQNVEKIEPGMVFMAQSPMGPLKVKVLTILDGEKAKVSVNHPLAGEDLTFKIKVESILNEEEVEQHKKDEEERRAAFMKAQEEMQEKHNCGSSDCASCDNSHD